MKVEPERIEEIEAHYKCATSGIFRLSRERAKDAILAAIPELLAELAALKEQVEDVQRLRSVAEKTVLAVNDVLHRREVSDTYLANQIVFKAQIIRKQRDDATARVAELERRINQSCGCGWIGDKEYAECADHAALREQAEKASDQ